MGRHGNLDDEGTGSFWRQRKVGGDVDLLKMSTQCKVGSTV